MNNLFINIQEYSNRIIRITYSEKENYSNSSFIVTAEPISNAKTDVEVKVDNNQNISLFRKGKLLSSVKRPTFESYDIYKNEGGEVEIRETADGMRSSVVNSERQFVRKSNHARLSIDIDDDETIFGLGSHEEGFPCINNQYIPLYQENKRISLPYFVSDKGYAYLFDCASYMTFDNRSGDTAEFYFDSVDAVDIYFIFGDSFDEICAAYRFLTGVTPMFPKWCCGYIQSKEYYHSQQELLDIATEYRRRKIPIDCIVQDWQYWHSGLWGDKNFDLSRYPDMKACTDTLHKMNINLIISVWSNLIGDSPNYREFAQRGLLLGDNSTYNAFDEKARELYWKQANEGLFRYGIDGWWCDSTEPFDVVWRGPDRGTLEKRMNRSIAEFKKYLDDSVINAYSINHSKGIYENQRKTCPDKRVVNITRSALSGQHRYSAFVWSGDISSKWDVLARQVNIMQNYIACGEAYWNCDIGGFFVKQGADWFKDGDYENGCDDEGYRELYTRWLQFAVFTPLLRSHGTDTPREIWRFGEEGTPYYEAIKKGIELRYSLLPFFYSANAAVTFDGKMPVKALALAFPEDKTACKTFDEYLYGDTFLVCPITEAGLKTKKVYLPEGIWYDYFTDKKYTGGKYIEVECELDKIPLFVKAGAIIPTAKPMQYVDEFPNEPYTVKVYAGADGYYLLYDDDGRTYAYENGEYSRIEILYDDKTGTVEANELNNSAYAHPIEFQIIG